MSGLSASIQGQIVEIVSPERARFDVRERRLYSHDTGVLPPLTRPLTGAALADGVVQPETESQFLSLVQLARAAGIPLVPRGRGTSGYGGAIPVEGGIVLDMTRYRGLIALDAEGGTATVRAGTVWKDLEASLAEHGLALRLYPTSAPSSTVGGWLAQGGAGIGSHASGWFKENVVSARLIGGDGVVRTVDRSELAAVADAEGTTGIVLEVTLRVRPATVQEQIAVVFPDAPALQAALIAATAAELPIWSISFLNPTMIALANAGAPKTHHGHPIDIAPRLPEGGYIVLFVYDEADRSVVVAGLKAISESLGAQRLPASIARHEWEARFKPMRLKRLGPSIVPAEVVVPLASLAAVLEDLDSDIAAPLALEGLSVRGGEIVLLGFIPHDERSFAFNIGYGFALSALAIAERHGGRGYATGRYFGARAASIMGPDAVTALRSQRASLDPDGIMNPGKVVFGNGAIGAAIAAASAIEPIVRRAANLLGRPNSPEERKAPAAGLPADVAYYAYACAQCGYCVDDCTLYQGRGWESAGPRGKWSILKDVIEGRDRLDQALTNSFLLCTTCEKCDVTCQLDLPIEPSWGLMRGNLVQERGFGTFPPFEIMAAALRGQKNIWGGLADTRADWVPEKLRPAMKPRARTAYFAGCTASFVEPDIARSAVELLDASGVELTYLGADEMCCGIPMLVAGKTDEWEAALRHNVGQMQARGVEEVVASCPACWLVWNTYYPQWAEQLGIPFDIKARHYSELLSERIASGALTLDTTPSTFAGRDPALGPARVTFHDSCHIGRAGGVYEPPRDLIRAIPGVELVEMAHNREQALCCGSVLTRIGEPKPTSDRLGAKRIGEAETAGADALLSLCPCCQFQLRVSADNMGSTMPVIDLARLTAEGMGISDLPDPNPAVLEQWAMFEKFIALMTVDGMVDVMDQLTPRLLEAMPLGMGAMMRWLGRWPAVLREPVFGAMTPAMPRLFSILLPGMMPKVLPHMIALVEQRIVMPEYLRQQLPDLFPQVVDNVMPKMLGDITPKYLPLLYGHLRR